MASAAASTGSPELLADDVRLPKEQPTSAFFESRTFRLISIAIYLGGIRLRHAGHSSQVSRLHWRPAGAEGARVPRDKIVIPEKIAIRLLNSSEVTAEQFYKHILEQYRILNHLQMQRQQFLQKQHLQLQQLEASNRFQEVFATATIIQAHPHPHPHLREPLKKPLVAHSNNNNNNNSSSGSSIPGAYRLEPPSNVDRSAHHMPLVLDTSPPAEGMAHLKRKSHRAGHYKHHRGRSGGIGQKKQPERGGSALPASSTASAGYALGEQPTAAAPHGYMDTPLNPAAGTIVQQPLQLYTSMPIPLILSPSNSEKRSPHHSHSHAHGERRGLGGAQVRRRTTTATVSGYDAQTYLNPFLTGELIFEK
nr:uncharacterized protein LOC6636169 [Drosophila virilis]